MPRTPSHPTQSHEPSAGKSGRSRQTHFAVREVPIQIVLPPAAGGARFEGRLDAHWTTRMTSRTRVVMVGGEGVIRVPAFLLKDREGAFHEVPAGCLSLTRGDFSLPSAYAGMFPHLNEGVCDAKARTIIVSFGLLAIPDAAWNIESVPMKVVVRSFGTRERGEAVFAGGVGLITSGALRGGMLNGIAMRPQWPGGGGTPPGGGGTPPGGGGTPPGGGGTPPGGGGTPPGGGGTAPGGGGTAPGGGGTAPGGGGTAPPAAPTPYSPGGAKPTDTVPTAPTAGTTVTDGKLFGAKVTICNPVVCATPFYSSTRQVLKCMPSTPCTGGCNCSLFSVPRTGGKVGDWRYEGGTEIAQADILQDRLYACFCAK